MSERLKRINIYASAYCSGMLPLRLTSLEVRNLRVLSNVCLQPASNVNWIVGMNGVGKTTLLEAIFLLGRGRSFRNSRQGPLMSAGASHFSISGRLSAGGVCSLLELKGTAGRKKLFANGHLVTKVRELRDFIQVRVLTENSQKLLEEQPALRRLFLDWNLFHVEHTYAELHERLRRTLSQRNAWLRSGGRGKNIWDADYARLSNSISESRRRFVDALQAELSSLRTSFPKLPAVDISFQQGWDDSRDLMELLHEGLGDDLRRGFTRYGPSRAELMIRIGGVTGIGSRGQSKLIVALLQYAAQRICEKEDSTGTCVWLLDDLHAEMDRGSQQQIWSLFDRSMHQIFVTSLDDPGRAVMSDGNRDIAMFHVEQGGVAILQR